MNVEDLNIEIYAELDDLKSSDPAFLDIQKKTHEYRQANLDYFGLLDSRAKKIQLTDINGKVVDNGYFELFYRPDYLARNIQLRNEYNQYFEKNKDKITSVEYQTVLKAYEKLVEKCKEDEIAIGRDKLFDEMVMHFNHNIHTPKGGSLSADSLARNMAARYYMGLLKRQYNAAAKIIESGTEKEKSEALKWQDDIISSLYSGKFEENIDNFIKNHPVGKLVYDSVNSNYAHPYSAGLDLKGVSILDSSIKTSLINYKNELELKVIGLHTIDDGANKADLEPNRATALEYVYEIEELCDIYKLTKQDSDKIDFDAYEFKVTNELTGSFDDKLETIRQKLFNDYNRTVEKEVDDAIASQQKLYDDAMRKKYSADADFHALEKEYTEKKSRYEKAKSNLEKISKLEFADETTRKVNEGVVKHQEGEYNEISERYGNAASKASSISRQAEAIKIKLDQMKAGKNDLLMQKYKENPYQQETNIGLRKGTHKIVDTEILDNGIKNDKYEVLLPASVQANRMVKFLGYFGTGKVSREDYFDFIQNDSKNIELLKKANVELPVKKTVNEGIEPGIAALEMRNKQLNDEQKEEAKPEEIKAEVKPEEVKEEVKQENPPVMPKENPEENKDENIINNNEAENKPEENKPEEVVEEEPEVEIDYSTIKILQEARAAAKPSDKKNPTFEEAHRGMVKLGILVDSVAAGNKGVWFGSKEYDDILKGLKAVKISEDYLNENAATADPKKLQEDRIALMEAKKLLAVQMKYYLKRKDLEKAERVNNNKRENSNSEKRRTIMSEVNAIFAENIAADEKALGLDPNRDKFYENTMTEIKYFHTLDMKNPELKDLFVSFGNLMKQKPENMTSRERLEELSATYKRLFLAADKYKKDSPVRASLLELGVNVAGYFLRETAEYLPDRLDTLKQKLENINKEYKVNIDTNVSKPEEAAHSYDDIIRHNDVIIKDQSKSIFNKEFHKKEAAEEMALFINNEEVEGYKADFDNDEKKALNQIRQSAYHNIFADIQKSKAVIFNPVKFAQDAGQFRTDMKNEYNAFHKAFGEKLSAEFSLSGKNISGDNAWTVNDIDLSLDSIKRIKDAAFKEVIVKEMTKLGNAAKKNDKADIEKGLNELNKLSELSGKIGAEAVYNSAIEVEGKQVTVKHLEDVVKAKANKALEVKAQKQNDKQPVKPQTGMKK